MDEPITLHLTGRLIAEAPLATCPPDSKTSGKNQPAPLPRMTLNGVRTPYFPGGGLRGTLRRRAVDLVRATLSNGGPSPFSVDDHWYLVLGGVKGDDKEDKADLLGAHSRRDKNPIVGLFGSGDPWQAGRLYVSHAIPESPIDANAVRGARVDDFQRSGDNLRLLSEDEQQVWLTISRANALRSKKDLEKKKLEEEIKGRLPAEEKEEKKARVAALTLEIAGLIEEASDYSNSINRPLDGYEVIPQGTKLNHSLTLSFGTMNEIGLLMSALRFWALDPWIGARKAHGCGIVSGEWSASMRRGYASAYEPQGTVTMTPFGDVTGPDMMMAAEEDFMNALTNNRDQFNFRYPSRAA